LREASRTKSARALMGMRASAARKVMKVVAVTDTATSCVSFCR